MRERHWEKKKAMKTTHILEAKVARIGRASACSCWLGAKNTKGFKKGLGGSVGGYLALERKCNCT